MLFDILIFMLAVAINLNNVKSKKIQLIIRCKQIEKVNLYISKKGRKSVM